MYLHITLSHRIILSCQKKSTFFTLEVPFHLYTPPKFKKKTGKVTLQKVRIVFPTIHVQGRTVKLPVEDFVPIFSRNKSENWCKEFNRTLAGLSSIRNSDSFGESFEYTAMLVFFGWGCWACWGCWGSLKGSTYLDICSMKSKFQTCISWSFGWVRGGHVFGVFRCFWLRCLSVFFGNDQCVKISSNKILGERWRFFFWCVGGRGLWNKSRKHKKTETQDLYQHLQVGVPKGC